MKPKLLLDPSLLKQFYCKRNVFHRAVQGKSASLPSISLHFGSAFHTFAAELTKTRDYPMSLVAGMQYFQSRPCTIDYNKKWMDASYLGQVFAAFHEFFLGWKVTPLTIGNEMAVEKRFVWPYKSYETVDIMLAGTVDLILVDHERKVLTLVDYKTTSLWDRKKYLDGYSTSIQMMFYKVLCRELFNKAGLFLDYAIECVIGGVFLSSAKFPVIEMSKPYTFSDEVLREMFDGIATKSDELAAIHKEYVESGSWPIREGFITDSCDTKFGSKCDFYKACSAADPKAELDIYFIDKYYDPTTHGT